MSNNVVPHLEQECDSIVQCGTNEKNRLPMKVTQFVRVKRTPSFIQKIACNDKKIATSEFKGIVFVCVFITIIVILVFLRNSFMATQSFLQPQRQREHIDEMQNQQNVVIPMTSLQRQRVQNKIHDQAKDINENDKLKQKNQNVAQTVEKMIMQMEDKSVSLQKKEQILSHINKNNEQIIQYREQVRQKQQEKKVENMRGMTIQQRRAARLKRQQQMVKKMQQENILKNITKNPYLGDQFANITQEQINRAKQWRFLVDMDYKYTSASTEQEKKYYQQKYYIDQYEEKPFCLVVPTYNNKARKRYLKNLKSILMQNYTNYRLLVIDDGSNDGTGAAILEQLQKQSRISTDRYSVVIHKERHFAMPNLRWAATNFCKPNDIFMIVDGDDELLGRQVLKLFNSVFQSKNVWFMYTNFLGSNGKLGYSRPYPLEIIQKNALRQYSFTVSHLRAYYTKLFLNIKEEDLKNQNGTFFTSANDMAISIPVMEQAHQKVAYIPQLTYMYNFNTGQNVHRHRLQQQRENNLKIRAKKKYTPLQSLFIQNDIK